MEKKKQQIELLGRPIPSTVAVVSKTTIFLKNQMHSLIIFSEQFMGSSRQRKYKNVEYKE